MWVLAFDTSGSELSVSIAKDKKILKQNIISESNKHSEMLIDEIEKVLREQKIWYQDLGLIVANKGPGSFTGTRVGVTAARIIKIATNIPLILIDANEVGESMIHAALEKFHQGEISTNLNPIYSQDPRIGERKK